MKYLIERLKEVSTWQGIIAGATIFGISCNQELTTAIVGVGTTIFTLVSVLMKGK